MPDNPDHGLNKDTVRADLQRACAIVHGRGATLSLLELCVLVMKDGLLNEVEREQRLAQRLAGEDEGTTPSPSPSGFLTGWVTRPWEDAWYCVYCEHSVSEHTGPLVRAAKKTHRETCPDGLASSD